ncbi:S-adenosyl-L-methionine-dependent methyltransferase [Podospora aff. communis PSN243]|uniref:S-adenosyl-L-methionine-dependent methyltransferase n=1 Tax=Podospora aff. communis PSN243 TaxID=3040156 RepID=A0AAV9GQQ0_9PEZI|nr:S-adenosyl-L-methionine-dependent methyltransferase [Podospora aff. communis PSN243]
MAEHQPIDVEIIPIDNDDSSSSSQVSSFTASLSDSAVDYPIEYGRRYNAFRAGTYPFPNDELELQRLDLTHEMMIRGTEGKLFHSPLDPAKTKRILDIGTGTGIWAMVMAEKSPDAQVLGNDLSAVQPTWVPPNLKFEIDDVESPWLHEKPFDFIFCRYMCACIADWPKLVGSIHAGLRPGAWAEFQDFDLEYYSDDGSLWEEHDVMVWDRLFLGAANKTGREVSPGPRLEGWVRDAGFQGVVHKRFKFPIGPWPRDPIENGLEAFTLRLFTGMLGWQPEDVKVLLTKVRADLRDKRIHSYVNFHVVYGQKAE